MRSGGAKLSREGCVWYLPFSCDEAGLDLCAASVLRRVVQQSSGLQACTRAWLLSIACSCEPPLYIHNSVLRVFINSWITAVLFSGLKKKEKENEKELVNALEMFLFKPTTKLTWVARLHYVLHTRTSRGAQKLGSSFNINGIGDDKRQLRKYCPQLPFFHSTKSGKGWVSQRTN